jgi:ABC-type phosphate transport system auxiliary subunit
MILASIGMIALIAVLGIGAYWSSHNSDAGFDEAAGYSQSASAAVEEMTASLFEIDSLTCKKGLRSLYYQRRS